MLGRSSICALVAMVLLGGSMAHAAPPKPKAKAAAAKPKPAPVKPKKGKEKDAEKDKEQDAPESDEPSAAEDAKNATKEEGVKSAGTSSKQDSGVKVKEDKADKEGVKTYKFETVEVEGRLKSAQVIYFLRRVRAEFEAGALGHRSFLGELSDSRRSAALR